MVDDKEDIGEDYREEHGIGRKASRDSEGREDKSEL